MSQPAFAFEKLGNRVHHDWRLYGVRAAGHRQAGRYGSHRCGLFAQQPGEHDRPARARGPCNPWRKFDEGLCQYVGEHHVIPLAPGRIGRGERERCLDGIALGVVHRRDECLRVDIDAVRAARAEQQRCADALQDLQLVLKSTQDQTARTLRTKEDLLVEENLLRLEIRRLRQALGAKADSVLSLEQRNDRATKINATRARNHTMGRKQKKALKAAAEAAKNAPEPTLELKPKP